MHTVSTTRTILDRSDFEANRRAAGRQLRKNRTRRVQRSYGERGALRATRLQSARGQAMRGVCFVLACALGAGGCGSSSAPGAAGHGVDDASSHRGTRSDDAGGVAADAAGNDATVGDEPQDGPPTDGAAGDPHQDGPGGEQPSSDASLDRGAPLGAVDAAVTPCRKATDCPAGDSCVDTLGDTSCMSTCPSVDCESTACDEGVCRFGRPTATCAIQANTKFCMPPCQSSADCPGDMVCDPDGACYQRGCTSGLPCPAYMKCQAVVVTAVCFAGVCTTDTQCPGAYCVDGYCQTTLGFCAPSCP
jgi:hypothetical protein